MKKILKVFVALILLLLAALLLSPLWISPVVRSVANFVVPKKTGTPFRLGAFGLNGYTGRLMIGDLQLENPAGFEQRLAVTVGQLDVDVDMTSVASDTIVIENIELKDFFVAYVDDAENRNNFDVILENVTGKKAAKPQEAPQKTEKREEKVPKAPEKAEAPKGVQKKDVQKEQKPAKKVIIDRLRVSGILVQYGKLTLPLPAFTLTGIGRKSNGVGFDKAWEEISAKFLQSMGVLGQGLQVGAKQMTGVLDVATKSVGTAGAAATKSVGNVTKSVGETATKSVDKAVETLGEGTGKAIDSLKGLFK